MSEETSPSFGRRYGIARTCRVWGVGRSTVHLHRARREAGCPPALRRGPQGPCPDEELVEHIRAVLSASPFHVEGYRKAWARLRHAGIRTSRDRVRRLMRQHGLSAPYHPLRRRGSKAHDGRVTTDLPDQVWGTDATQVLTREGTAPPRGLQACVSVGLVGDLPARHRHLLARSLRLERGAHAAARCR